MPQGKSFPAGKSAGVSGYLQSAQNATRNIVLDGCKVACGAKIFEKAGIPFEHYVMTDFDVEKGKTPITGPDSWPGKRRCTNHSR